VSVAQATEELAAGGAAFSAGDVARRAGVTRQAAEISKQIGRPVKVIWPREEDLAQDKQRPLAVAKLEAALPRYLPTRRWFGAKGRKVKQAHVTEAVPLGGDDDAESEVGQACAAAQEGADNRLRPGRWTPAKPPRPAPSGRRRR